MKTCVSETMPRSASFLVPAERERRELRVSPSTDNDSYGATQNVERNTKRERDWEEARKERGAPTSFVQVETMSVALRLRDSRG